MSEREEVKREFTTDVSPLTSDGAVVRRVVDLNAMADEIVRLRSQLAAMTESRDTLQVLFDTMTAEANKQSGRVTTAERERDEAREQLRLANLDWANCAAAAADHRAEADALRHRAERMERVVEAAKEYVKHPSEVMHTYIATGNAYLTLLRAVNALDATPTLGDA